MKNQNILAIDTCTEVCSVSLYTQGETVSRFVKDVTKSSGLILPLCDEVFAQTGLSVADLDAIVYTKGPGAFTGVRMCVSVVQGMSLAFDIPTKGFSTLEVLGVGAAKKYKSNKIAVALDARMSEVYWGVYEQGVLMSERLAKPDEVDTLSDEFIGVGTGWGAYKDALMKKTGVSHYTPDFYPKSQNLIDLYLNQKPTCSDELPLPTYLRNNVAQKSLK
ncbi:tRNA (adenosine(37)-N6)-threonylcarbamoyltransferase complex dimerization subunit type 1 TsaB [bacterium endosymbiont of Bathymodiolus sp. 5 South]|jgi:tRNA threonylcarbamoyladenosine biosynthesis protein TsaB|uniref:tRNA (adenosine(37)-N6)-threonylcarbamoyltransferase complex dimerization subunit type 1 TsaB n=1 Tax=bacterium endosymbiont of Bathymodiolus sp. 5 South TaxID=1181670 RepID=UPI0010AFCE98|nr:tRNA (adenosine(37)-N6)-threonylcarbamoyltransferase complex dimerization subunit type 1 TsaB [bacterium endosymbiont of Bathymodiolus sp. 5 South]CAC9463489.1 tRNA threonylcarbamoyladenosine biosynthesis protein TsaB [uncultured Gammaproteobacteria bacterium]CAC9660803.1 tRNA threonylcarbamoyladenosine biosynthesis protein TsaB [uncultured Gammaproteobacteria bacterium]SHN89469.1 TsaB protein, required for threonylcarbamoyladenosine (t(6)A) formation in tRNA [bacterium endosymbiont of Bathym